VEKPQNYWEYKCSHLALVLCPLEYCIKYANVLESPRTSNDNAFITICLKWRLNTPTHTYIYIYTGKKKIVYRTQSPVQLHFIRSEHFLTLIRPFGHAATHTLRYAQLSLAYPFYILSYSLLQLLLLLSFKVHQSFNIVWSQLLANISPPHPSQPTPPTSHHALHFPLPILPPLSFVILP